MGSHGSRFRPGGNGFEGAALRLRPDVGVVAQHLPGDVSGDRQDGFVGGAALGKFRYRRMSQVVKTDRDSRLFANVFPGSLE